MSYNIQGTLQTPNAAFNAFSVANLIYGPLAGNVLNIMHITATGTSTVTFSSNARSAMVQLWGAGGGSRNTAATAHLASSGGGAGGYCQKLLVYPTGTASVTLSVGGGPTENATDSIFVYDTFSMTAGAGLASALTTITGVGNLGGGAGGVATGGDVNVNGQTGHGVNTGSGTGQESLGSPGGVPFLGIGLPGPTRATSEVGYSATGYAAGAGGACNSTSATARNGGFGAPGLCIITEYL